MDVDDEELYGKETVEEPKETNITTSPFLRLESDRKSPSVLLSVLDVIENIGPLNDFCIGFAPLEKVIGYLF
jgi:hypothetical protein